MRPEGSPLDLNHLPEDFTRDGNQVFEDPSTSGQRKKKNNGKEESEKVYECRFCSLKFCKSQALGGHMNRHRQERETETLNKARQLVYTTDNSAAHPLPLPRLGPYAATGSTAYHTHHQAPPPPHVYPTRPVLFPGPPREPPQSNYNNHHHHHQSCAYMSTPPRLGGPPAGGDYYMAHGHALTGSSPTRAYNDQYPGANNYTCVGVPVGVHGLDRDEGGTTTSSWGRSYNVASSSVGSEQHHMDSPY